MSQVDQPEDQLKEVEVEQEVTEQVEDTLEEAVEAVEVDIASLQSELEKVKSDLVDTKDASLRVQAEMQNVRRRAEQDVEKAHKFALEKMAKERWKLLSRIRIRM